MASKEVERRAPSVPELAPTPATTLTAEDIKPSRIYVANYMSEAFKRHRVEYGDLFLATGADDPEPQVLWHAGSDEPGALVHVLHLRKAKSWDHGVKGGPLTQYRYEDPAAPDQAWVTWNYTLYLPEVDQDLPARMLLARSGRGTAQRINTVLMRNAAVGPMWSSAFRLTTSERKDGSNEWAVIDVRTTPAEAAHVQRASELFELIRPGLAAMESRQTTPTGEEPGI